MKMMAVFSVLSIALLSTAALADAPSMMCYQGTLTDGVGVALDTTVSMTFTIYTDSTGGSTVWTETQPSVAVTSGIFNVLLGRGTSIPDTVFKDPERWLGVQVGGDAELEPRQRIAAAGYAFRAAEADTADFARSGGGAGDDGDWTIAGDDMYSAVSGNVGIGTTGPGAALHVSSTADQKLFQVDDAGAGDGTPFVIDQDGNVGINFQTYSTPQTRLHVMGPAGWIGDSELLRLELAGTYGGTKFIQYADSTYDWGLKLEDTNGNNRLTISYDTGNVGIGTESPAELLDVVGTTQMTGFKLPTGATNAYVLTSDGSGVGTWQAAVAGADSDWSLTGNAGTSPGTHFLGTIDDQALELKVNSARALRLEPDFTSPNLIGGPEVNWVTAGVVGGVIGGGGESGANQRVTDTYGTIAGGVGNTAGDNSGTVADKMYASVGGGVGNTASGQASTVPGGGWNTAAGDFSFAAGRRAKANHKGCFVWGDSTDADVTSTASNQFVIRASGGVGTTDNQALDLMVNSARALRLEPDFTSPNLIGGPEVNWVTAGVVGGVIGGGGESGANQRVTDTYGTIAGGVGNTAGDNSGTVADKMYATVGGGVGNTASGQASTVPGGGWNTAAGDFSFASGRRAQANHKGCFVWGDSADADVASTGDNQFLIRASGGVGIGTTSPGAALHVSSTADQMIFRADDDGVADGTPFVIDQDGNVGINFQTYSAPQTRLHIMGPGGWSGDHELLRLELAGSYGGTKFIQYADSSYDWGLKLEDTNGVNRLTISYNTGNVGIGTTSPARPLHVNDVMRLEPRADFPSSGSDGDLCVKGTAGSRHIYCYLNGDWRQLD